MGGKPTWNQPDYVLQREWVVREMTVERVRELAVRYGLIAYAASRPMADDPGSRFDYNDGVSVLLNTT